MATKKDPGLRTRAEKDFLGAVKVPVDAYYGIQTARAVENFPISGLRAHPQMIRAAALIKKAAAEANATLGLLDKRKASAIARACDEVIAGRFQDQFVVDVFQMGAGTSFHMNVNEVLANRAEEILGGRKGEYLKVHPHDDVNLGQSTNDVYPTAMRLAAAFLLRDRLLPEVSRCAKILAAKGRAFGRVVKAGRTHLQDAPAVTLGQEFKAYGLTLRKCGRSLQKAALSLLDLGIGGTAVGTGLNAGAGYRERVVRGLVRMTGLKLKPAGNLAESMQSLGSFVEVSAALRGLAVEAGRVANDLRLLASGPRTGLAEISLPPVAPGSSIMPGKVNPSMLEMLNMVCFQVIGSDLALSAAAQAGQLELNVMMPVVGFNLHWMIGLMANALSQVSARCLAGIRVNSGRCLEYAEKTLGSAAALTVHIGYARAAEIARLALESGKTLRQVVLERGILSSEMADRVLDPERLANPHGKRRPKR